jgi:hypothetical protein
MLNGWPPVPSTWLTNTANNLIAVQLNDGRIRLRTPPFETRNVEELNALSIAMSGRVVQLNAGGDMVDRAALRTALSQLHF